MAIMPSQTASAFPRRGLFCGTGRRESASLCREHFPVAAMEVEMALTRKSSYQPTSRYNAYLTGWIFAFSVVLVTFVMIAHGVHF